MSPDYTTDVAIWDETRDYSYWQKVTLKEIDLDDIFTMKNLSSVFFAFENYTQQVAIDMFYRYEMKGTERNLQKYINIIESPQEPATIGCKWIRTKSLRLRTELFWNLSSNIYKIDYNNDQGKCMEAFYWWKIKFVLLYVCNWYNDQWIWSSKTIFQIC